MHYWISYCARQALGVPQPQAKGPQGQEGTITCPIVHWRAFFILFHHFIDNIYVYFGDLSLSVTMFSFLVKNSIMSKMYM